MVSMPADTPVMLPEVDTAALLFAAVHAPPVTASVSDIAAPTQTADGPDIVPALGIGFTVTIALADKVPQLLVTEYWIVSIPCESPVTRPELVTNAWLFVAFHDPPVAEEVSVMDAPTQTEESPLMVPVPVDGLMVISILEDAVPQPLVTI